MQEESVRSPHTNTYINAGDASRKIACKTESEAQPLSNDKESDDHALQRQRIHRPEKAQGTPLACSLCSPPLMFSSLFGRSGNWLRRADLHKHTNTWSVWNVQESTREKQLTISGEAGSKGSVERAVASPKWTDWGWTAAAAVVPRGKATPLYRYSLKTILM